MVKGTPSFLAALRSLSLSPTNMLEARRTLIEERAKSICSALSSESSRVKDDKKYCLRPNRSSMWEQAPLPCIVTSETFEVSESRARSPRRALIEAGRRSRRDLEPVDHP